MNKEIKNMIHGLIFGFFTMCLLQFLMDDQLTIWIVFIVVIIIYSFVYAYLIDRNEVKGEQ